VFQGGVTESPKPLSPGTPHPGSQRGSASGPSGYAFSNRGSGPQLPSLPQAIQMQHGSMPPPAAGSQPGSMSSHSGGSGASGREILAQQRAPDEFWSHVREMETRMTKMQEDHLATVARIQSDHARLDNDLRAKINQLEAENKVLRESQSRDAEIRRLQEELAKAKSDGKA